ncbi:MAG: glycogen/starch synthase [Planctomycetes bacterium]|nr:glycogen/starch synthase [Planctomycetota bacterium]
MLCFQRFFRHAHDLALDRLNPFACADKCDVEISGGLGTACHGLTRAMSDLGHHVIFVLPRSVDAQKNTHVTLRDAATTGGSHRVVGTDVVEVDRPDLANVSFREIPSTLRPYVGPPVGEGANQSIVSDVVGPAGGAAADSPNPGVAETEGVRDPAAAISPHSGHYGGDMFAEVQRYAAMAVRIAESESFDVVHAHDWMTFPAGLAVARLSTLANCSLQACSTPSASA